jgi:hypothetical protein
MRSAILASLLVAAPGLAHAAPPVPTGDPSVVDPGVPERFRIAIGNAQLLGDLLAKEDIAAWVATDAMLETGANKKIKGNATGWVTRTPDPKALQWVVSFTAKDGERQYSFADVTVLLDGEQPRLRVDAAEGGRTLEPEEELLLHARDLTMELDNWLRCSAQYNYSMRWGRTSEGREIVVTLLPARKDDKVYPFGGFHEFHWSTEPGGKPSHFAQTQACIDLQKQPDNLAAFLVSHLNSDAPTQFHVFQSLSYGLPVMVFTNDNGILWKVDQGHISVVQDKDLMDKVKGELE